MKNKLFQIDLFQMAIYLLKRCWLIILCAAVGFGYMYWRTSKLPTTYTASGTMYIYNGNPNQVNYGYTNTTDLNSALQLMDTYMVVVRSNRVLDRVMLSEVETPTPNGVVIQTLQEKYPWMRPSYIAGTLSMGSVAQTGVLQVRCTTDEPQKSADICNAVLLVAPGAIKDVVGAGQAELIDAAATPFFPDVRPVMRRGLLGGVAGAAAAAVLLVLLYLLNQHVSDVNELISTYKPQVLAQIKREKKDQQDPGAFLLNEHTPMDVVESYGKLRMNLLYLLNNKENRAVEITSAISGEGKSTVVSNLAVSMATNEKRVLLVDADMRRACLREIFHYQDDTQGLSDVLAGELGWHEALLPTRWDKLSILPAGHMPPNPSALLESEAMRKLLADASKEYDVILLDAPPINIVSDPLVLSGQVTGSLFVVRQGFSDHREIRKALNAAKMTGMEFLGFVFYGEHLDQGNYYSRKYYRNYYRKYDNRSKSNSRG